MALITFTGQIDNDFLPKLWLSYNVKPMTSLALIPLATLIFSSHFTPVNSFQINCDPLMTLLDYKKYLKKMYAPSQH